MAKVEVGGREFHYERVGSGEPLLLIRIVDRELTERLHLTFEGRSRASFRASM